MLSDTIGEDTVDCINTASGYQIRVNGVEIGFISYHESRAKSKAESFQFAAMIALKEKQRQERNLAMFNFECPFMVQEILDSVTDSATVISVNFVTQSGETRTYRGTLGVGVNKSHSVAINTESGWKRFSVDRVTNIEILG